MPQQTSKAIDRLWAESFAQAISQPVLPPGEGWLTRPQIVQKMRISRSTLQKYLYKTLKEGKMERFAGQQIVKGRPHKAVYYRPKG